MENQVQYNWPVLTIEENTCLQLIYAHCAGIAKPNFADVLRGAEALIPIAQVANDFNAGIVFLSTCVPQTAHQLQQKYNTMSDITNAPITTITDAYQQLCFQELMGDNYVPNVEPTPVAKAAPVADAKFPDMSKTKEGEYHDKLDNYRRRRETLQLMEDAYKATKSEYKAITDELQAQLTEIKQQHSSHLKEERAKIDALKKVHADKWTADMYRV